MKTAALKLVTGFWLLLTLSACVMTPLGEVAIDGTVSVEPQVVYSSRSRVTISIGPNYSIDDAFYMANSHCRGYGYYAVPSTSWDRTYHSSRNLMYYCRRRPSVYYSAPVVVGPSHHDHHNHRPTYPTRPIPSVPSNPPRTGWWSRNQPIAPTPAPPASRRERETRSTTPSSPWSYNSRKNEVPPAAPAPVPSTRSVTSPPSPWSYKSKATDAPPKTDYSKNPSYSTGSSSSSSSTSPSAPVQGGSSSKSPGWWGKNK